MAVLGPPTAALESGAIGLGGPAASYSGRSTGSPPHLFRPKGQGEAAIEREIIC
jgi:hypothetical protein